MHNVEFDELRGIVHDIGKEWKHKTPSDLYATVKKYQEDTGALDLSERQDDELFEIYQSYKTGERK